MSEAEATARPAIRLQGVGKAYRLYPSRVDSFLDATSMGWLRPWRRPAYRPFWALRDFDLELGHGQRIGIIGRNGSGKSTLLKLICGALTPTEGTIEVDGDVQALLDGSGGLHDEFTGLENIRATLTYQGLSSEQIAEAAEEIATFTELGDFMAQPVKTYSLGMRARLAYAIATSVDPQILIVDEVLGAGDGYFVHKSNERARKLVERGAAVIVVSHSLTMIERLCDDVIWLERGRIVEMGPSLEVIKAYERFLRNMEERRTRFAAPGAVDSPPTALVVAMRMGGPPGAAIQVTQINLMREGSLEEQIELGAPQDDGTQHAAHLIDDGGWSAPLRAERYYRELQPGRSAEARLPAPAAPDGFSVEIIARIPEGVTVTADIDSGGSPIATRTFEAPEPGWVTYSIPLGHERRAGDAAERPATISHWRGSGELAIARVAVVDEHGTARLHHSSGSSPTVVVEVRANIAGDFRVIPAVLIFRSDAVVATRHLGEPSVLSLDAGASARFELELSPLLIGNGRYTVSAGLYRSLSVVDTLHSEIYDYLDRSCELAVYGLPPLHNEIAISPGSWSVIGSDDGRQALRELRDVEEGVADSPGEDSAEALGAAAPDSALSQSEPFSEAEPAPERP
jgi:ABC-type polysaccharide/polyol phosphate transport system ATPase subunit